MTRSSGPLPCGGARDGWVDEPSYPPIPHPQTVYLPIPGLVDVDELKPGDLVGTNKDSFLILEKLPTECGAAGAPLYLVCSYPPPPASLPPIAGTTRASRPWRSTRSRRRSTATSEGELRCVGGEADGGVRRHRRVRTRLPFLLLPLCNANYCYDVLCCSCDKQITELIEAVVLPLSHGERFKKLGILAPKGVLLYGRETREREGREARHVFRTLPERAPHPLPFLVAAPGTGKTLLARACARSTNAVFLKLAGTSLVLVRV